MSGKPSDTHPRCFDTQQQFNDWLHLARTAREQASPCGDCSRRYKHDMTQAKRCFPVVVRRDFSFIPASAIKKEVTPA